MFNVVEVGNPEAADYFLYPEQHPSTLQYLQNQFQNISSTIMDSGLKFVEDSKRLMEKFYDSSIERAARAAVRMAKNLVHPNSVQRYTTLEEIQSAPPLMQRYIMTDPYLREKYHSQLCSGYAGSYIDVEPGYYEKFHYDWRRVNDGIVKFEDEDEEHWVSTSYFEDLKDGDRALNFDEKIDILSTIDVALLFAGRGEDPTDPFGSKIG